MKNKYSSKSENNLEVKNKDLLLLPRLVLSTGLTGIGIYTSYLGYHTDNDDLGFLGIILLSPGLIGLSGLIYYNFEQSKKKIKSLKIGYRTKRFFLGESGIIEKVQEYSINNKKDIPSSGYSLKDNFGNLPQFVTYRNQLGELKTDYAMEERVIVNGSNPGDSFAFRYKTYKTGDKFP